MLSVLLLGSVGLMLTPQVHAQPVCVWSGTGTWESAANWSSCGGGAPRPGDFTSINSGTVTVTANENPAVINVQAGATIVVNSGVTLTTFGDIVIAVGGSVINYGTIIDNGGGGIVNDGVLTNCGGTITSPGGKTGNPIVNGGPACAAPTPSPAQYVPPVTIGGTMLPINRLQVILPWVILIMLLGTVSVCTLIVKRERGPKQNSTIR